MTDAQFTHAVLYLLPVVSVTVLCSSRRGLLVAVFATAAWVIADILEPGPYNFDVFLQEQFGAILAFAAIVFVLSTFRDALAEAHAADLRSRAFLSEAAHQLRTPIASVQACAETLIMSGGDERQEPLLILLATETQRVGRLVNALLQLARIDQGESASRRPTDLGELCAAEIDLVRHRSLPDLAIDLVDRRGHRAPLMIDPDATREALANLLDNARRHAATRIELAIDERPGGVVIAIRDDGPGLTPDVAALAFDRFASLDGQGGSGLGLPIARAYIQRQGGALDWVDGAFVIQLPAV